MKVAIYSTHILWPTHFETDLEIIENHLLKNDEVFFYACNGELKHCELIFENAEYTKAEYAALQQAFCEKCIAKRHAGLNLLTHKNYKVLPVLPASKSLSHQPEFDASHYLQNHEVFKTLTYKNFDIGWAMLSSFISLTQNPNIVLADYEKEIRTNFYDCINIYENAVAEIQEKKYDRVYVFNGRLSYTKAIFRAAQSCNVDCYIIERGATTNKYSLFVNHTIHNIEKFKENAVIAWNENKDLVEKEKIANQFYINRRNGIVGSWHSMTDLQKEGHLPKGWSKQNKNIVFFTSSDDEFASIDDSWKNPYFETQLDAIKYVKQIVEQESFKGWQLYVRVHPNAQRLGEAYFNKIKDLESDNVKIIEPTSPISSYALIDDCDVVMSVGSTIAYEAVYAGKYTIQLGKSLYYNFQGPINPYKKEDIEKLLIDKKAITPPQDIFILGYFMMTYGIDYKFYKADDYINGSFKNVDLNNLENQPNTSTLQKIKSKIKSSLWKA